MVLISMLNTTKKRKKEKKRIYYSCGCSMGLGECVTICTYHAVVACSLHLTYSSLFSSKSLKTMNIFSVTLILPFP
jgi:hypothetical protein